METMTLMPMAVAATSARPRIFASYVRLPETHGAMPSVAAIVRDLGCKWSPMTNGNQLRTATTKAHKAFGTRRLGETST
jgi:hypothetical protein